MLLLVDVVHAEESLGKSYAAYEGGVTAPVAYESKPKLPQKSVYYRSCSTLDRLPRSQSSGWCRRQWGITLEEKARRPSVFSAPPP